MTKAELEARVADLQAQNALLKKVFEQEHDRANEWQEVAENQTKANEQLKTELKHYIEINEKLRTKRKRAYQNETMYKWFNEYLAEGDGKETAYYKIYDRAIEAGFIKEVKHKDPTNKKGTDWDQSIKDKVRKRLNTHRNRHKKAIEDRIKKGLHI